jgi:hypothetical protein
MLSLFVVQVVGVILRIVNICDMVGRDVLNILWSVKVLLEYEYSRRLFIVGGGVGYILGKTIEFNVTSEILKPIVSIVLFYTALRLFNRYQYIIIGDMQDPAIHGSIRDRERIRKCMGYISFNTTQFNTYYECRDIQFMNDWEEYKQRLFDDAGRALFSAGYNSGSDEDNEKTDNDESDSDESSDLVECDHCGEKNIDPNELDESEKNLADIGGGYAHEYCMTEEQIKEYEVALRNESEDDETDEELEQITNDDFEEENSKPQEEEPESIKRGWFDWTKRKEKTV